MTFLPYILAGSLALAALTGWQGYRLGEASGRAAYAEAAEIQRRDVQRAEAAEAEAKRLYAEAQSTVAVLRARNARQQGPATPLTDAQAGGLGDVLRGE